MSANQRKAGKTLVVLWDYGGTTYTVSGDYTAFDPGFSTKAVNMSAGADDWEYEKPIIKRTDASLNSMYRGTEGTAEYAAMTVGNEGTLSWGSDGTASGKPKGSMPMYVKEVKQPHKHEGETEYNVIFGPQGDLISDPATATW